MTRALLEIHKRSCHRKQVYLRKAGADKKLVVLKIEHSLQGKESNNLVTYYCRNCNYWHIGHINDKLARTFKKLGIVEENL